MISLVVLAFAGLAASAEPDLTSQLTDRYRDQIFVLRHSFASNSQHYDPEGNLRGTSREGSWTLYGRLIVRRIVVEPTELRVEGVRAMYEFNQVEGRLIPHANKAKVQVVIRLNAPLGSSSDADSVLGRVFALTFEDVVKAAPSYWRRYLETQAAQKSAAEQKQESAAMRDKTLVDVPRFDDKAGEKAVDLKQAGVTPPKPQFTPEPEFTDVARKTRHQGVVTLDVLVNKEGRVSDVQVVKPLGWGLDDNAAITVKTWRFAPAKRNGNPAACAFNVEVDFHLYDKIQ
jgi:TonB family protein